MSNLNIDERNDRNESRSDFLDLENFLILLNFSSTSIIIESLIC